MPPWCRGHVEGDECGMIKGVGPVPVATVRAMLDDAFLGAVVTDGVDIRSVVHMGRRPTTLAGDGLVGSGPGMCGARLRRSGRTGSPSLGGRLVGDSEYQPR